MSEDLPKQELLIKLLKMSTSPNDGEALISIRKANDLLRAAGWDWEKLIHGKIKVIEDPFKHVETPFNQQMSRPRPAPPPPPRPRAPTPPPPPRQSPPPPQPLSTKANIYAGWCYCCGDPVINRGGFIFDPHTKNAKANSKWQIICQKCNTDRYLSVGSIAAPRQRPIGNVTPNLNDI